eukprot:7183286-Alexandrium_andersonii.AAC.1
MGRRSGGAGQRGPTVRAARGCRGSGAMPGGCECERRRRGLHRHRSPRRVNHRPEVVVPTQQASAAVTA